MASRRKRPTRRAATLAVSSVLVALMATACTSQAPAPVGSSTGGPSQATSTADPTANPTPGASAPTKLAAGATTPEALAFFVRVVRQKLASDPQPHGRDIIDALVSSGFDKKTMELTADSTSIGRNVDSIEFSVRWRGADGVDCLLGQVGGTGFASSSAPVLKTGKCLVGATRAIDW